MELDCSQQECESLQEQLQLQRKTAASSLNRIQKHSQKKTVQLQVKLRELSDKLKEVGRVCGKGGRKRSLLSGSYYCVDLEVICNVAVMCPVNITLKCGLDWLQVYFPHKFEQHCKQCSIAIIVASQVAVSNTVPCIRCVLPR